MTKIMEMDITPSKIINTCTREQTDSLLVIQHDIMEQLALGKDHQSILDALCKAAEALIPNAVASVMMFDRTHSFLEVIAAPSIPQAAVECLNGLEPGPQAGSCDTAVFSNKPQYICSTADDIRWRNFQQFILDFNVLACWSNPICIDNKAIGSFALSSFEARQPTVFYKRLLENCAYIAGIVFKRQQEESQLWKLAHYDQLTNLPNRSFFNSNLEHAIQMAKQSGQKMAVLFLDLDKFKDINDTQGHDAGDQVLKYIADNIQSCLRLGDFFARLGGDEFVILIENISNSEVVDNICNKINSSFKAKLNIGQIDYPLTLSIGVSIYPDHGDNAQILLRNADAAMYEAKKQSDGGHFQYYQDKLTQNVTDRLLLATDLRQALDEHQFIVHYQPQYCNKSGQLVSAEALVRWQHPTKGLIPPDKFITITEQSGLIDVLGIDVLITACQQCCDWWRQGRKPFSLAVNLSVRQLRPGIAQLIHRTVSDIGFPVDQLEMEVTESLIMNYNDLSELCSMNELGIKIAMDDFGTGYSSLAQLKHLPISKLKIDRSFVKDIPDDPNDMVIAKTIISMGHSLGLKIVAEGVETEFQRDFFSKEGCDLLQGYFLSRPLPADQFEQLLA